MHVAALLMTILGGPVLLGALARMALRTAGCEILAIFASTVFIYLLEYLPLAQALRMGRMITTLFGEPFRHYSASWVGFLFCLTVLARVAVPYLLARTGVWLGEVLERRRDAERRARLRQTAAARAATAAAGQDAASGQ